MPDTNTIEKTLKKKVPQVIEKFTYIESSQIPLVEIPYEQIKETIIDPTTGLPYKGMILKGCFADLSNQTLNNNGRFYDVPKYLELVRLLKKQIHSAKGVYGEYEHPKGYAVFGPRISHKILDIWYDEKEMKVYGIVLLMNTEQGLKAQEVVRSGGRLAISARAAGEEIENPDGSKTAITKLLVTYDLVYHPGFSNALLEFVELNESQKMNQLAGKSKKGFSGVIYEKDLKEMDNIYAEFVALNESTSCFYEWLFESQQKSKFEQQQQQQIIEQNQTNDEDKYQKKLEKATDKDLTQSKKEVLNQMYESQQKIKRKLIGTNVTGNNVEDKAIFDNSAGFINNQNADL